MKEWFSVARSANGQTVVTCSLQDDNLSSKFSIKCNGDVKWGVAEASKGAHKNLAAAKAAIAALGEDA